MRISDWSSDVCSSDLARSTAPSSTGGRTSSAPWLNSEIDGARDHSLAIASARQIDRLEEGNPAGRANLLRNIFTLGLAVGNDDFCAFSRKAACRRCADAGGATRHDHAFIGKALGHSGSPHCVIARSEEHTSELQSLMRISYAVFCLKKKKH